jgi:hypothetical protein
VSLGGLFWIFVGITLLLSWRVTPSETGLTDPWNEGIVILKVSGTTHLTMQCVIPADLNPQWYHSENLTLLQTLGFSPGDRDHLDNFLVLAFQRNLPPQFNLLHTSGPAYHHRTRTSEYKTCHWWFCTWRNHINFVLWEKQKYEFYVCADCSCRFVIAVVQKYILSPRTQLYLYMDVLNTANIEGQRAIIIYVNKDV